jgi:hypothetical protein
MLQMGHRKINVATVPVPWLPFGDVSRHGTAVNIVPASYLYAFSSVRPVPQKMILTIDTCTAAVYVLLLSLVIYCLQSLDIWAAICTTLRLGNFSPTSASSFHLRAEKGQKRFVAL